MPKSNLHKKKERDYLSYGYRDLESIISGMHWQGELRTEGWSHFFQYTRKSKIWKSKQNLPLVIYVYEGKHRIHLNRIRIYSRAE